MDGVFCDQMLNIPVRFELICGYNDQDESQGIMTTILCVIAHSEIEFFTSFP